MSNKVICKIPLASGTQKGHEKVLLIWTRSFNLIAFGWLVTRWPLLPTKLVRLSREMTRKDTHECHLTWPEMLAAQQGLSQAETKGVYILYLNCWNFGPDLSREWTLSLFLRRRAATFVLRAHRIPCIFCTAIVLVSAINFGCLIWAQLKPDYLLIFINRNSEVLLKFQCNENISN